jgi:hypothetical protein
MPSVKRRISLMTTKSSIFQDMTPCRLVGGWPQNLKSRVHAIGSQISCTRHRFTNPLLQDGCGKGSPPRDFIPIMLTTGTQIDPVTRVARNPRLFPPVDPECWSISAVYRELLRLSVHFLFSEGLPN